VQCFIFLLQTGTVLRMFRQVAYTVKGGGHVIVSTFGPEGLTKCSELDVIRYDAESLHGQFGVRFRLVESSKELHRTPFGTTQQFLFAIAGSNERNHLRSEPRAFSIAAASSVMMGAPPPSE
jgi:hypothetical protein